VTQKKTFFVTKSDEKTLIKDKLVEHVKFVTKGVKHVTIKKAGRKNKILL